MTAEKYIEVAAAINTAMEKVEKDPNAAKLMKKEITTIANNYQISTFEVASVLRDLMESIQEILTEDNANRAMFN